LGSMIVVVLCPLQNIARESKFGKSCNGSFRSIMRGRISPGFSWFRGYVGMIEPIKRVVQIGIGSQCEREPAFARGVAVDAKIAFGPLQKGRRHWIKFNEDGAIRTESPRVRERGENSFSTINGAKSEHALGDHAGPGEQFGFEKGGPSARLFRDRQKLRPRDRRFPANCLGFRGPHRFSRPA